MTRGGFLSRVAGGLAALFGVRVVTPEPVRPGLVFDMSHPDAGPWEWTDGGHTHYIEPGGDHTHGAEYFR